MSSKSNRSQALVALLLGTALLPSVVSSHIPIPPKEPSEIDRRVVKKAVPEFKLTDQDGKPFEFSSTHGKLVLVTFIFTTCPDVCPLLTAKLASIHRTTDGKKMRDYSLVSIT